MSLFKFLSTGKFFYFRKFYMTLRVSSIFSFNIFRVKFAHASQNPTTCECPSFYRCFGERELSGDSKWIFSLKIDSISPCVVMDHKWRENVIKNKKVAQEGPLSVSLMFSVTIFWRLPWSVSEQMHGMEHGIYFTLFTNSALPSPRICIPIPI